MCGICGEIRFDGHSADVAAVTRMTCAMESRGPDSDGVVAHGPIALGHRRLSIIDLFLSNRALACAVVSSGVPGSDDQGFGCCRTGRPRGVAGTRCASGTRSH